VRVLGRRARGRRAGGRCRGAGAKAVGAQSRRGCGGRQDAADRIHTATDSGLSGPSSGLVGGPWSIDSARLGRWAIATRQTLVAIRCSQVRSELLPRTLGRPARPAGGCSGARPLHGAASRGSGSSGREAPGGAARGGCGRRPFRLRRAGQLPIRSLGRRRWVARRHGASTMLAEGDGRSYDLLVRGDLSSAGSADLALEQHRGERGRCGGDPDAPDGGDPGVIADGLVEE
jgi:hypothetical protein